MASLSSLFLMLMSGGSTLLRQQRITTMSIFVVVFVVGSITTVAVSGLAVVDEGPVRARPVVIGTSPYSNVLFGKLQRASSLWGTNLEQPVAIIQSRGLIDTRGEERKLNKCLWDQFFMSNPGPDGILELDDFLLPPSSWIPNADIRDAILFFDATAASSSSSSGNVQNNNKAATAFAGAAAAPGRFFSNLFGTKEKEETGAPQQQQQTPADDGSTTLPDPRILDCAEKRNSSHWYVLVDHASVESCFELLQRYKIPSTMVCIDPPGTKIQPMAGWVSSRPQNMEGEFQSPIELFPSSIAEMTTPTTPGATRSPVAPPPEFLYSEDAAELMLQISLRADRGKPATVAESETATNYNRPRLVFLQPSSKEIILQERPNSDYFSMMGGKKAKERAGTVRTITNWKSFLSPLGGYINDKVGRRPDSY